MDLDEANTRRAQLGRQLLAECARMSDLLKRWRRFPHSIEADSELNANKSSSERKGELARVLPTDNFKIETCQAI